MSTAEADCELRRQKFVDDLIAIVRDEVDCDSAGSEEEKCNDQTAETIDEVARYALLQVEMARSRAKLAARVDNGQKSPTVAAGEKKKKKASYFSISSMLGLDVMSGWTLLTLLTVGMLVNAHRNEYYHIADLSEVFYEPCIISSGETAMEMVRSPVNCDMCRDLREMPVEHNMTRELFLSKYAYTARPVLIKNIVKDWKALNSFSLEFFRDLYDTKPQSYAILNQARQFFPHKTEFGSLKEALHMSAERQRSEWYFAWSNIEDIVGLRLREYYTRPVFLPEDAESSRIDWMFMGISAKGAQLHIDYVNRPSWQAQIKGRKIWEVVPSPECMSVCHSFNVTVHAGDIINIDTNRWYHATYVYPGDLSITIGSEYD